MSNPLTSGERFHVVRDLLEETDARTYLVPDAVAEDLAEVGVVDRPERLTASDDPDGADSLDRTAPPCPNPVGTSPGRARTPREPANIATPFSCSPTETVKALPRRGSIG